MRRIQLEFDDNDLTWRTIEYASLYLNASKRDFAKKMLSERVKLFLKENEEIRIVIDSLMKKSTQSSTQKT